MLPIKALICMPKISKLLLINILIFSLQNPVPISGKSKFINHTNKSQLSSMQSKVQVEIINQLILPQKLKDALTANLMNTGWIEMPPPTEAWSSHKTQVQNGYNILQIKKIITWLAFNWPYTNHPFMWVEKLHSLPWAIFVEWQRIKLNYIIYICLLHVYTWIAETTWIFAATASWSAVVIALLVQLNPLNWILDNGIFCLIE